MARKSNPVARNLRTPKFRSKVIPDKKRANPRTTKYNNFKNHFATHILGLDEPEAPTNSESGTGRSQGKGSGKYLESVEQE